MVTYHTTWTGSLHQTFRLLPTDRMSSNLASFLEAHGLSQDEVIDRLPYDVARACARGAAGDRPDPKRFRDGRQVYETAGFLCMDDDGRVNITRLGDAVRRWIPLITPENSVILARHAAYALAACQLRNPTGAGRRFDPSIEVFPFAFIWRAMLHLDGRISSDELNRGIFKVRNEDELNGTIDAIAYARRLGDIDYLGNEVVSGGSKNDRIIPWMSLASFGWTLFPDKRGGEKAGYYELIPETLHIVLEASRIRRKHRDFESAREYVEYVAQCAALPKDVR